MAVIKFKIVPVKKSTYNTCWVAERLQNEAIGKTSQLMLKDPWKFTRCNDLAEDIDWRHHQITRPKSRSVLYTAGYQGERNERQTRSVYEDQDTHLLENAKFEYVQGAMAKQTSPYQVVYDSNRDTLRYVDLHTLKVCADAFEHSRVNTSNFWRSHLYQQWKDEYRKLSFPIKKVTCRNIMAWRSKCNYVTYEQFSYYFGQLLKRLIMEHRLPKYPQNGIYLPDLGAVIARPLVIDMDDTDRVVQPYDVFQYDKVPLRMSCAQLWHLWCNRYKSQASIREFEMNRYSALMKLNQKFNFLCELKVTVIKLIVTCSIRRNIRPQLIVDYLDFAANMNSSASLTWFPKMPWIIENIEELSKLLIGERKLEIQPLTLFQYTNYDW
ncbi:unnamed protein product [Cyberlindnera jadinii]|uniref:Uncharacterized protein n=1 Tax=Cyberlindnera jadinii (strain ATCC 18201 / CBS 1600 / BCRC 20928 / JCM 3617 / NBRC 0987 / NRRL Y-1542) TaxID=983966 RepID=A0A0H5CKF1_CYBJN|nr:unnamed protein product [Cyberlindnera jadinii]